MTNAYLRFRTRMAQHALLHFAASLRSSLEYILLAFAPMMVGLIACLALPGLLAATRPWTEALALITGQVLLASAPVYLLRKRLHPAAAVQWSHPLPIAPRSKWLADAMVAGMLLGPLSIAYALSTAIWLYQWPDWLRPAAPQALLLTVLSLLLAWLLSTLILAHRNRRPAARKPSHARAAPAAYTPSAIVRAHTVAHAMPAPPAHAVATGAPAGVARLRADTVPPRTLGARGVTLAYYWLQLFWRPFWRAENVVGIQQSLLLAGAASSVAAWMWHPPMVPPAVWGACAALMLMLLTDRGDKAVAEQIAILRPVAAGWPLRVLLLYRLAISFTLLPGLCVLCEFAVLTLGRAGNAANAGYSHTVAMVWLMAAVVAQTAIVALRRLSVRGRVGLVITAILILTAIGSELWN